MTYNMLKLLNCFFLWCFCVNKSTFTREAKRAQTGMKFHFGWESHFGVQPALYLRSHELRQNETQIGMHFISVILNEMKFQTGMKFSCEQNLPEVKWINADTLDITFNVHVRLKLIAGVISLRSFWQKFNFISGYKTLFHVSTIRNEMPTHVHKNIGSF